MNDLININKNIITFFLIILFIIPIFGIKFFIGVLSNIFLLLFLIPLLLLLLVFIGINSYKPKINTCNKCGSITLGFNQKCMNCGADLGNVSQENELGKKPSESTIEIKAEEIK